MWDVDFRPALTTHGVPACGPPLDLGFRAEALPLGLNPKGGWAAERMAKEVDLKDHASH
jgi:hypothetical protein